MFFRSMQDIICIYIYIYTRYYVSIRLSLSLYLSLSLSLYIYIYIYMGAPPNRGASFSLNVPLLRFWKCLNVSMKPIEDQRVPFEIIYCEDDDARFLPDVRSQASTCQSLGFFLERIMHWSLTFPWFQWLLWRTCELNMSCHDEPFSFANLSLLHVKNIKNKHKPNHYPRVGESYRNQPGSDSHVPPTRAPGCCCYCG